MSQGEQLFVRGMTSEGNDMWNDSALVKAYDKAMRSYKPVDMAKRLAMATNKKSEQPTKPANWRVGAPCRATFQDDGLEYEAFILEMEKDQCVVRFVGYEDDAIVKLENLKPSLGNAARTEQIHNITTEPSWKEIKAASQVGCSLEPSVEREVRCKPENMDFEQDDLRSVDTGASTDKHSNKRGKKKPNKKNKKSKSKKGNNPLHDLFTDMPKLPTSVDMDPMLHLKDIGVHFGVMPFAPPTLPSTAADDDEQEDLNNLLTAWYMSGYYAGIYQSRLKKRQRN